MLNWETVDAKGVYPSARYYGAGAQYEYRIMPQHDGWWHLVVTNDDGYVIKVNCRGIERAKRSAEQFEFRCVTN